MNKDIEIIRLNNEIRRLEAEVERLKALLKLKNIGTEISDFRRLRDEKL